jgi:hypothetical protein
MSGDAAELLESILTEHGGRAAFGTVQFAAARTLASALAQPETGGDPIGLAKAIDTLQGLLPPRPDPNAGAAWDLTKLSDKEFHVLERLHAVATGTAPPSRTRTPRPPPETPRTIRARELADLLDKVNSEGRKPTEAELTEVRNHLSGLMGLLGTLTSLLPPEVYATPTRPLTAPAEPEPKPALEVETTEPPPPSNVVPLRADDTERAALKYGALYVGCALERNLVHGLPMDGRDSWEQRR